MIATVHIPIGNNTLAPPNTGHCRTNMEQLWGTQPVRDRRASSLPQGKTSSSSHMPVICRILAVSSADLKCGETGKLRGAYSQSLLPSMSCEALGHRGEATRVWSKWRRVLGRAVAEEKVSRSQSSTNRCCQFQY
jgi:hypothetical protein